MQRDVNPRLQNLEIPDFKSQNDIPQCLDRTKYEGQDTHRHSAHEMENGETTRSPVFRLP